MNNLKEEFLLDPQVIFLNHGSFGATPRPVLEVYQAWQRRLERQPVQFLAVEYFDHLRAARQALGDYLHACSDEIAFLPNATFGVNVLARSLRLAPGDEILATDHEYGACDNTWEFVCQKTGARYIRQPIPFPFAPEEEILERLWQGLTTRTRAIFISHITSPTALVLPVKAICQSAREAGILTIVDGAHAPGQIPLDLEDIGVDFYSGNCHKWMMAPKGAGFLFARKEVQHLVEPLVVSWGWGEKRTISTGSDFLDYLQWIGTQDPSAYLSVPAAIQFMQEHDWTSISRRCHELLRNTLARISDLTGLLSPYPDEDKWGDYVFYQQMAVAPIPPIADIRVFKDRLFTEYSIEIPVIQWTDWQFLRLSVQGYNTQQDMNTLVEALVMEFPRLQ